MAKTWRVVGWNSRPPGAPEGDPVPFVCDCGEDANVPTAGDPGSPVIAVVGRSVIFDSSGHSPPRGWLPEHIQCRKCARHLINEDWSAEGSNEEASHVG
jgi:hypothetical protein